MVHVPRSADWVLITGASSGIGEAFAKRFASEGYPLVLLARTQERLEALAHFLKDTYQVQTLTVCSDLTSREAPKHIEGELKQKGIELYGLVNNAGFGASGCFTNVSLEKYLGMIDVMVRALVELTHRFLPEMIQRKRGFVINVSSTASFQPLPSSSVYSAGKAFVTSFTEALWLETRGTGVRILNLCPGLTKTDFGIRAGTRDFHKDPMAQTPEAVVETAFRALRRNKPTIISCWFNRLLVFLERFVPHRVLLGAVLLLQKIRGRL
ncbi:MAG: SDR family oxidoreductase [Candidatus Omnitrophica bacterium]|nr:SDR family oxidoreductase [Candidatus Omnitrophota bacterium]